MYPAVRIDAAAVHTVKKKCGLILATIPALPCLIDSDGIAASTRFQTFSLEDAQGSLIKEALLDRFLACMKPASIT
jgi:hypothetical protein